MAIVRLVLAATFIMFTALAWAQNDRPGIAVDSRGGAVIDPTKNVLDLVAASIQRQDDLRSASDKFNSAAIANIKLLFDTEIKNIRTIVEQQAAADERLRIAESKRIDAIRLVDVNNVAVASQKADQQATTLAAQVTSVAEALRKSQADSADRLAALVQSTATTQAASQQQQFASVSTQITGLGTRLTTLEQVGAEGKGKALASDPGYQDLVRLVNKLADASSASAGKGAGISDMAGWIVAGLMLLIALGGLFFNARRQTK